MIRSLQGEARQTFRAERVRAVATGVVDTAGSTFLQLIAVRWYDAGPVAKALISSGYSVGYLAAPFALLLTGTAGWTTPRSLALFFLMGAILFLSAAVHPSLEMFLLAAVFGVALAGASLPLVTQLYRLCYPSELRGRIFSRTTMIRISAAMAFSYFAGHVIEGRIHLFPILLLCFGCAMLLSRATALRLPEHSVDPSSFSLRGFEFVLTDKLFRNTLVAWFLLGLGNLIMYSVRVEYLAAERYGLHLTEAEVTRYAAVIPLIVRVVMSPLWGYLFDRMNFFLLRMILNASFLTSILVFYSSNTAFGLTVGAIVFGFSNAGGEIAWNLWVTKFAPPERVAQYMSVHTFFTGLRGMLAPFVAFAMLERMPIHTVAWYAAGLIVSSCLLLVPEVVKIRR